MLIVAVPKSASTSLLYSLSRLHKLPGKELNIADRSVPGVMKVVAGYHSDVREISDDLADQFASEACFYKQHIPPTESNLALLRDVPKVVVVRDATAIAGAYYRAERRGEHNARVNLHGANSIEEWLEKADKMGLVRELEWFVEGWRAEAAAFPDTCKIVRYRDLVAKPRLTVNKIESFFGLERSDNVVIARNRYSRRLWDNLMRMVMPSWDKRSLGK